MSSERNHKPTHLITGKDLRPFIVIGLFTFILLFKLFFPQMSFIVTPDFGLSDSFHKSLADKYVLWETVRSKQLPFWNSLIGGGTPVISEGQIGAFYLPNLILPFLTSNFTLYYNILIFVTLFLISAGTYRWLRSYKLGKLPSLYAGMTAVLSGIVIPHLTHLTLLQSLSLMPWIWYGVNLIIEKPSIPNILFTSFLVSQQIFTGFPQLFLITMLAVVIQLFILYAVKKINLKIIFRIILSVIIGVTASSIQMFASYDFKNNLNGLGEYSGEMATYFSFPFKHLSTLINPFMLGNPHLGTYPHFQEFSGSIFWENTAYIGLFPLFLIGFLLFNRNSIRKYSDKITIFFVLLIFSFLLMTGKFSPFYFIFSFFPLNLFRVPSRFITIFSFSLLALSTIIFDFVYNKTASKSIKYLLISVFFIHVASLIYIWHDYHAIYNAEDWMAAPESIPHLNNSSRIKTIGFGNYHNQYYLNNGWQNIAPYYQLRNYLEPNSNVIWHIPQIDGYRGRALFRNLVFENTFNNEVTISSDSAQISKFGIKLLELSGTDTIISPYRISSTDSDIVLNNSPISTYIYNLPKSNKLVYQAKNSHLASTVQEALTIMKSDLFFPDKDIVIESKQNISSASAEILIFNPVSVDGALDISVTVPEDNALIVYNQTYYPGWKVKIDERESELFPVNIRFIGTAVPAGKHKISFYFYPDKVKIGAIISITTYMVMVIIFILKVFRSVFWH